MTSQREIKKEMAFAHSPLAGKRILVTRPEEQAVELCDALRRVGAEPVYVPLIVIVRMPQYSLFQNAVDKLQAGDWIFLTSQNAPVPVSLNLWKRRPDLLEPGGLHIAAVGPATAEETRRVKLPVDFVPKVHKGVAIAEELGERLRGCRVLLPRSDKASSDLPEAVRRHGGEPLDVVAYRTELSEKDDVLQRIAGAHADAVTLFSPSELRGLQLMLTDAGLVELGKRVPIVAVGEVTAQECRKNGVRAPIVAADTTVAAVIEALIQYFAMPRQDNFAGADRQ